MDCARLPAHGLLMVMILCGFAFSASSQNVSVTLEPVQDATLFENDLGEIASGSGPTLFVGDNSQLNTRRVVLAFVLGDSIPSGSEIVTVELLMHVSNAPNSILRLVTLHRILNDWGEGASSSSGGAGAPAQEGDATWLHTFYPGLFWQQPGGDFVPEESGTTALGESGFFSWSGEGLVSDVQQWLDDPAGNFGWLLKGEEGQASSARGLDSRESDVLDRRPALIVEYKASGTSTERRTWGDLKAGYWR